MDTSLSVCSAAVSEGTEILAEGYVNCFIKKGAGRPAKRRTHSELLMPMIDKVLADAGVDVADIDVFAVVNGPGSFTGVRIGVCAAKALAQATGKPVAEISSLHAMAYPFRDFEGTVCAMADARNAQAYYAFFKNGERITEDTAGSVAEMLEKLSGKVMFVGDGAAANRELLCGYEGAVFAPAGLDMPKASYACMIAETAELTDAYGAQPAYIRPSQAERSKCAK